jgi:hypothetical protein
VGRERGDHIRSYMGPCDHMGRVMCRGASRFRSDAGPRPAKTGAGVTPSSRARPLRAGIRIIACPADPDGSPDGTEPGQPRWGRGPPAPHFGCWRSGPAPVGLPGSRGGYPNVGKFRRGRGLGSHGGTPNVGKFRRAGEFGAIWSRVWGDLGDVWNVGNV